jgi:hypothetical protein
MKIDYNYLLINIFRRNLEGSLIIKAQELELV